MRIAPTTWTLRTMLMCGASFVALPAAAQVAPAAPASTLPPADAPVAVQADAGTAAATSDVVVTGSRITRRDYVSDTPIATLDAKLFDHAGPANVETLLNQLPQFSASFTSTSNNPSNRGRANLDLRGLGAARTLVLLDGYRFSANPSADVSVIPSLLVQNVEVLTGGASAVYGSDAVAGVVNFKLRHDLQGVLAQAEYGVTEQGDGVTQKYGLALGSTFGGDDRGHFIIGGEYFNRAGVDAGSRAFATTGTVSSATRFGAVPGSAGNLPSQAAVNGIFAGYGAAPGTVSAGSVFGVNPDGTLFSLPSGANFRTSDSVEYLAGGQHYVNTQLNLALQLPQTRYSAYAEGSYKVAGDVEAYAKLLYTDSSTQLALAPTTVSAFSIPVTNPFVPASLRTLLASRPNPAAALSYNRIESDLGSRIGSNDATFFMGGLGLRGPLPVRGWTFDVFASRTHERTDVGFSGLVSRIALQTLLSASDGGASLCTGGYNPFGTPAISASCAAYISKPSQSYLTYDMSQLEATVQGGLVALPGGTAKLLVGLALRRYAEVDAPDAGLVSGDTIGFGFPAASSTSQSSVEEFAELFLPLLRDLPFAKALNITVGGRHSKYSLISPGVYSYKAEGDWEPVGGLRFRGGYQHAIRVPTANTLVAAQQRNTISIGTASPTSTLGDPCDVRSSFRQGSAAAQVRSLCLAQGVPASLVDTYTQSGTITNIVGGNPALQPETANTYSIGAVLTPHFASPVLRNLQLTVDYYNIAIRGATGTISATTSLASCYNQNGYNPTYAIGNPYCATIVRDPTTGNPATIYSFSQNLGGIKTSGIDAQLNWTVPLGRNRLSLAAFATRLLHRETQTTTANPFLDYVGTIAAGPGASYPRWKTYVTPGFGNDRFSIGFTWRYIAGMTDASLIGAPSTAVAVSPPAVSYFDLQGSLKVTPHLELYGTVNNLGNKQPPFYTSYAQFNTDPSTYDTLGRRFSIGLRTNF